MIFISTIIIIIYIFFEYQNKKNILFSLKLEINNKFILH